MRKMRKMMGNVKLMKSEKNTLVQRVGGGDDELEDEYDCL